MKINKDKMEEEKSISVTPFIAHQSSDNLNVLSHSPFANKINNHEE
jgi:hypothetical protein